MSSKNNNNNFKGSRILREEEEESRRQQQGACSSDYFQPPSLPTCSICYERIVDVPSSPSPEGLADKCQKCLTTMKQIPSGFPFDFAGDPDKAFECPICGSIIKEAHELPTCHHVMCRDCLLYYENERRSSALKNKKYVSKLIK